MNEELIGNIAKTIGILIGSYYGIKTGWNWVEKRKQKKEKQKREQERKQEELGEWD